MEKFVLQYTTGTQDLVAAFGVTPEREAVLSKQVETIMQAEAEQPDTSLNADRVFPQLVPLFETAQEAVMSPLWWAALWVKTAAVLPWLRFSA